MNQLRPIAKVEVDPDLWSTALAKLQCGELDRPAAAELLGLNLSTLNTRLRRGKHLDSLKAVRRNAGEYHPLANPDKAKVMAQAVADCLETKKSVRHVWMTRYKEQLNYSQLCQKVKAASA